MHRFLVAGVAALAALALSAPAGAWTWPADGAVLRPFGLGSDPYAGGQHRGVDVAGAEGAPIRAPAAGTVTFAGSIPTHGRGVTIQTADGYAVTIVHLGAIGVAKGATVAEGAPIGTMGWSGTPEHAVPSVHLGIRRGDDADAYVDPLGLLPSRAAPAPAPDPMPTPEPAPAPAAPSPAQDPGTPPPAADPSPSSSEPGSSTSPAPSATPTPTPSGPGQPTGGSEASPPAGTPVPSATDPHGGAAAGSAGGSPARPGVTISAGAAVKPARGNAGGAGTGARVGRWHAGASRLGDPASAATAAVLRRPATTFASSLGEPTSGRARSSAVSTKAAVDGAAPPEPVGASTRAAGDARRVGPGWRSGGPAALGDVSRAALRDAGMPIGPLVAAFLLGCLLTVAGVRRASHGRREGRGTAGRTARLRLREE